MSLVPYRRELSLNSLLSIVMQLGLINIAILSNKHNLFLFFSSKQLILILISSKNVICPYIKIREVSLFVAHVQGKYIVLRRVVVTKSYLDFHKNEPFANMCINCIYI